MNTEGAVRLAAYFRAPSRVGTRPDDIAGESIRRARHIIGAIHMVTGGVLDTGRNAWIPNRRVGLGEDAGHPARQVSGGPASSGARTASDNIMWSTARHGDDGNIVWGTPATIRTSCGAPGTIPATATSSGAPRATQRRQHSVGHRGTIGRQHRWGDRGRRRQHRLGHRMSTPTGTSCGNGDEGRQIVWGTATTTTGTSCGAPTAAAPTADNVVWGCVRPSTATSCGGTADDDANIVWGTG